MTGAIIPEYHGGFDSDTDSDDEDELTTKPEFDVSLIFNLRPSLAGAGGMDDNNSVGTNSTGASDATQMILEEGQDTGYDDTDMSGTVISSITETTTGTPPPKPRNLNDTSNKYEGNEKWEHVNQQEGTDNMELDNKDTTQQANSTAITATGNSPNNHEGKHQENNRNNDDMEDSGGESNNKDKGGGGGRTGTTSGRGIAPGRGRNRYQLDSQGDVGGRGGQHISEKGNDTIAAHKSITTIVIQKMTQ